MYIYKFHPRDMKLYIILLILHEITMHVNRTWFGSLFILHMGCT